MIRLTRHALALGLVFALAACQQSAPPASTATPAAAPATPAAAPAAPAATPAATPAPAAPVATVASANSIGIAECDDYLNKYQACVESKVPEAARAGLIQSLDQTRTAWRTTLAAPGGKDALANACKQMRDSARASMSAYGCSDF